MTVPSGRQNLEKLVFIGKVKRRNRRIHNNLLIRLCTLLVLIVCAIRNTPPPSLSSSLSLSSPSRCIVSAATFVTPEKRRKNSFPSSTTLSPLEHHHYQQQQQQHPHLSAMSSSPSTEEGEDSSSLRNGHERLRVLLQNNKCPYRLVVTDPSQHYYRHDKNQPQEQEQNNKISITHVKTLIWEATQYDDETEGDNNNNDNGEDGIESLETKKSFCFITATKVSDKVDEEILQHIVNAAVNTNGTSSSSSSSKSYQIQLAETNVAQRLTGYTSGTIPPFCHIVPMMTLYMDESILMESSLSSSSSSSSSIASIGSGLVGYDIELNTTDFVRLAEQTTRCTVCSMIDKQPQPQQQLHNEKRPVSTRTNNDNDNNDNGSNNGKLTTKAPTTEIGQLNASLTATDEFLPPTFGDKKHKNKNKSPTSNGNGNQLELHNPPKSLSKRLRDAAGKAGKAEEVRQIIKEAGADFPNLVTVGGNTDGNFTKNALHLAAWKGDIESVRVLVEAGHSHDLPDFVNIISQGEGNYGKSPIFYALTQCRDDCVLALAEDLKANLLIVNNKGQTPCSMAPSHLKPSTCEILYRLEAKQLEQGGSFVNYRISNSDHKRYGDLDPRFPIDDDNMTPELEEEIKAFTQLLVDEGSTIQYDSKSGLPLGLGFPRSLKQTTREIRHAKGLQHRKNRSKQDKQGNDTSLTNTATEKNNSTSTKSYIHTIRPGSQTRQKRATKRNKSPSPPPPTIDVTKFDCLELMDLLPGETQNDPFLVQDMEGVEVLAEAIEEAVQRADEVSIDASISYPPDNTIAQFSWGLDCEWKPSRDKGRDNPVATLQLSTPTKAFLVDLQELCQPSIRVAQHEMSDIETFLSAELQKLFRHEYIAIVGFGIGQDLSKMAMSFPHIPCFRLFEAVVDIQMLSRSAYSNYRKDHVNSLQKAVAITMGKRLDKTEQCSDWQDRPLSKAQIVYAVLDAVVSRELLILMLEKLADGDTYENDFYQKHAHLRQTVLLEYMGCIEMESSSPSTPPSTYRVPMGAMKKVLDLRFAKQTWPTGKQPPPPPEPIPLSEINSNPMGNKNRSNKKKVPTSTDKTGDDHNDTEEGSSTSKPSKKGKGVSLTSLYADYDGLPAPGSFVGFTKDSCVNCCIGNQLLNSMPSDIKIRYNRWGGIIAMANAWLLFINFKGHGEWKYQNEFSDDGRCISFSVNPSRQQEELLLKDCTPRNKGSSIKRNLNKRIFLFVRPNTRSKFLFCGECECVEVSLSDEDAKLDLELLDYTTLMKSNDNSFRDLVVLQNN